MTTPTRTQVANKVYEVAQGIDALNRERRIDDIPKDFALADGAREIAVLTLTAISHDFEFKPVMAALEKLAALEDWSHSFFVAHLAASNQRPTFDWREAPMCKYESFADFYHRELERTFGSWENLQHTWSEVVKGKITEDEGRRIILRKQGRPRNDEKGGHQENDSTFLEPNDKNTKAHWLARLDDKRPDLAAKVRARTMSANAAAIEAGFRKPAKSRKMSPLDRAWKLVSSLSQEDQNEIRRRLREQL